MGCSAPLISIISCTAVWNLPCTFRLRHAACRITDFSLVICDSCATSSTAESTTSYGPWPVRSDSPETLSRSFCRWSFGSVHRSFTADAVGAK